MNKSFLHTQFLYRQRVFVRADLNVNISMNGQIRNDKRLRAILPTIEHIQSKQGKVILATHIGRPSGLSLEHNLSTRNIIPWLEEQGFLVDFEGDLIAAQKKTYTDYKRILLLENMRFFKGEKTYSMPFAELLSNLADVFVNDAFGTIHRGDTSISLLPQLFLPQNRGWGFLIEQELQNLELLQQATQNQLLLILGGAKITDKIPLLKNFLQHTVPDSIILGGKIALPFLAAQGILLGKSMPTQEEISLAQETINLALNKTKLILPQDAVVCSDPTGSETPQIKTISTLGANDYIIDIGPQSSKLFDAAINQAQTIFMNGTMGLFESENGKKGTQEIISSIAKNNATKIIGGGDAVAAVEYCNQQKSMTFLSTGGGATLAYLSSENPWQDLPGLKALGPAA